jgi:isopenicillin-N N-acyltransferase-like protein
MAASRIKESLSYYREALPAQTGLSWEAVLARTTQWHEQAMAFAPDLFEEVRGIADGAELTFDEVFLLNVRGEVVYDARFESLDADDDHPHESDGCTSFAIMPEATGDGHVYAGQNWDWRFGTRHTLVIVRVVEEGKPTIIYQAEAGQVARQGANSAGIALNANGLGGRFEGRSGVPQTFIRRKALEATTFSGALGVLIQAESQIASNALVTTREGFSIDLETTPGPHDWLYPEDGILVHGNHYQGRIPPQLAHTYRPRSVSSLYRVPRARVGLARVAEARSSADARDRIHSAMSDQLGFPDAVCCAPDENDAPWKRWSTLLSSCVDLTTGEYYFTAGPPDRNPYQLAPWNLYT